MEGLLEQQIKGSQNCKKEQGKDYSNSYKNPNEKAEIREPVLMVELVGKIIEMIQSNVVCFHLKLVKLGLKLTLEISSTSL